MLISEVFFQCFDQSCGVARLYSDGTYQIWATNREETKPTHILKEPLGKPSEYLSDFFGIPLQTTSEWTSTLVLRQILEFET